MISLTPLVPFQTALKVYASLFYHCPHQNPVFILERNGPIPVLQHTLTHTSHSLSFLTSDITLWRSRTKVCSQSVSLCVCVRHARPCVSLPTSIFYFNTEKRMRAQVFTIVCVSRLPLWCKFRHWVFCSADGFREYGTLWLIQQYCSKCFASYTISCFTVSMARTWTLFSFWMGQSQLRGQTSWICLQHDILLKRENMILFQGFNSYVLVSRTLTGARSIFPCTWYSNLINIIYASSFVESSRLETRPNVEEY